MTTATAGGRLPGLDAPANICPAGVDPFSTCTWVRRDTWVKDFKTGQVIFEQKDVECPEHWSQEACNVLASKYFFGLPDTPQRETSVRDVLHRIARTITDWGTEGGHFDDAEGGLSAESFYNDLAYLMLHQYLAFNSPVWFNMGLHHVYGVAGGGGSKGYWYNPSTGMVETVDPMARPQASACFILKIEDSIKSIFDVAGESAALFKFGSGVGMDLSPLRSKYEALSGGGKASGPLSFGSLINTTGGTLKSGGRCLAPGTFVYTTRGPKAVETLTGSPFEVISYDPPANRYKVKTAQAWKSGVKSVVKITTDKGEFRLSSDHPVRLSTGNYCRAGELRTGQSLFSCSISEYDEGYVRVSLKDGRKGKELLHRLVAMDILGADIEGLAVHHRDNDRQNNHSTNLEILPQAEHARLHGQEAASRGDHIFQLQKFPKPGAANGMHSDAPFWKNADKSTAFKDKQSKILRDAGRATGMAKLSVHQRYLNTGYRLLEAGESIPTVETFFAAYEKVIGRIDSKKRRRKAFVKEFGSYAGFLIELSANNHRVISVESCGQSEVYSVEVDCQTEDDKSASTGHNFVIWPDASPYGSGLCCANTRRSAIMLTIKDRHPEFPEFIDVKRLEEKKAKALIDAGYPADFNGEAYGTVGFQNANLSARLTNAFMEAARANAEWQTYWVTDPKRKGPTLSAAKCFDDIVDGTWECGDPGVQFEDTIQDWHTCPNSGAINSSNPCCFVGSTLVDTSEGRISIERLQQMSDAGEALPFAFGYDLKTQLPVLRQIRKAWVAGRARTLVEVETQRGLVLRCTPEHRFLLHDGTYVEAQLLTPGTRLRKINRTINDDRAGRASIVHRATDNAPNGCEYQNRWMWEQVHGPISANHEVHHVNEDPTDDRLSNFELIATSEHRRLHGQGESNPRFIDAEEVLLLEIWEAVANSNNGRPSKVGRVTMHRWNSYVYRHNLRGKVPLANGSKGIRGLSWGQFESWIRERQLAANDQVTVVRRLALDTEVPVYDIEVDGVHNFGVTDPNSKLSHTVVVSNSEFMFLDDTACNLASLRLTKFLKDGAFMTDLFRRAVRILFRAMEIMVGEVSYPTSKVAKASHDFRPLGIGYADLGALLMSVGVPYDSDNGRGICGAITALMTGEAYHTSAYMASQFGAFAGYKDNRAPMLRVMNKHRAAVKDLRDKFTVFNQGIVDAAQDSWDNAISLGERSGFRNAQASVLAPTGTIAFVMDCATTGIEPELGLVKYKNLAGGGNMKLANPLVGAALENLGYDKEEVAEILAHVAETGRVEGCDALKDEHLPVFDTSFLAEGGTRCLSWKAHVGMMAAAQPFISGAISKCVRGDSLLTTKQGLVRIGILHRGEKEDTFRPEALRVASLGGLKTTDAFYYGGTRPTIGVTLRSGHRVVATHVHPLLVCRGGKLEWKKTADIVAGDYVATQYGSDLWPERQFQVTGFSYKRLTASKDVTLPSEVTADFGFLLGSFAADGNYTEVNGTVTITKGEQAVRDKVVECWRNVFGIEAVHYLPSDRCAAVKASSKEVVAFLKHLGVETGSANKRIPDCILQSPKPVVLAFLQGLFQDSYIHNGNSGKWGICVASPGLIDDLSAVLTNLGIVHGHAEKWNKEYERYYHELYVTGDHAKLLFSLVPFNEEHKKAAARIFLDNSYSCNTADVIPGLKGRELHALLPSRRSRKAVGASRSSFSALLDDRTKSVSRRSLERIASAPGVVLPRDLRIILDNNLHFSPVVKVEDTGECEVYDVSVPDTHAFVANGIVNHNTINFPKDATRAQIKEAIVEAWHKKLKAVAMYRDGSKWSQPLSTSSTDSREATIPFGQRRKLPKTREAFTHHFRVGGHDGYVTPGMYKDGTPGEIFIKMNKEGSTVAGLMDTIAILTSISLQHGVPLELLVDKLSYMDFEPRGLTDNPQVPTARSVVDYIFRWLGQRFNPKTPEDDDGAVELYPTEAAKASQAKAGWEVVVTRSYVKTDKVAATPGDTVTGPPCPCCGSMTIRTGPCFSCRSCGNTTGGCG